MIRNFCSLEFYFKSIKILNRVCEGHLKVFVFGLTIWIYKFVTRCAQIPLQNRSCKCNGCFSSCTMNYGSYQTTCKRLCTGRIDVLMHCMTNKTYGLLLQRSDIFYLCMTPFQVQRTKFIRYATTNAKLHKTLLNKLTPTCQST